MAMMPAITIGMMDFMIMSGFVTEIPAIPVPAFAVPYAAPSAVYSVQILYSFKILYSVQIQCLDRLTVIIISF